MWELHTGFVSSASLSLSLYLSLSLSLWSLFLPCSDIRFHTHLFLVTTMSGLSLSATFEKQKILHFIKDLRLLLKLRFEEKSKHCKSFQKEMQAISKLETQSSHQKTFSAHAWRFRITRSVKRFPKEISS